MMSIEGPEAHVARRQLERVLASSGFARNERMARFLRFVVEQSLAGKNIDLKESVIAVEVFGRRPDHDLTRDSIVRTEAGRLRARLREYYTSEGKDDPLVIELPKGGYVPAFRKTEVSAAAAPVTGPRKRLWVGLAATVCVGIFIAGLIWWWTERQIAPITIAVLPLENLSHDPADDYFADGLTDELIRNLAIIDGLAPRSRTSSFAFRGKPQNVREVGRQLGADYVVEGSVLHARGHLRIDAQLIRVRDDVPLWSGRFDRELADIFAIQDEISRGIVNSLRLKLGHGQRRYETNTEAYDLYLRARSQVIQRGLRGLNESVDPYEKAIARDPSFAPAYAGLATAHAARSGEIEYDLPSELAKMRAAAEKAVQLDPLLAEAHQALGIMYARDSQWDQSETSFRRAIEIDPNSSEGHNNFAMFLLLPLGRIQEAIIEARLGQKADPISPEADNQLASILISASRYGEAAAYCEKLPVDFPDRGQCLGRVRLGQGRIAEGLEILEAAIDQGVPAGSATRAYLGYAYGRTGRREQAEKYAAGVAKNPFQQALTFAGLRDKERTLAALDRMAVLGPFRIGRALTYPELAFLRGDARLRILRRKVGLPD